MSPLCLKLLFLFVIPIQSCNWSPNQCGCAKEAPSTHHRIVGGTEARAHSWPWIVSVRRLSRHICGGTAINNRHVLTAAHCFKHYHWTDMPWYTFAMGHHSVQEEKFVSNAKRIVIHKSYNTNGRLINDIALIELERTIDFTNSQMGFICLPLSHANDNGVYPPLGSSTWVVGWGATYFSGAAAPTLRQVSVPVTTNKGCTYRVTEPKKQICAGFDKGGKDSCQGDSGGPLTIEVGKSLYELVGIVSFGQDCAKVLEPGIYTRVSGYIDWINENLNRNKSSASQNNQGGISSGSHNDQGSSQAGADIMGVLPEALTAQADYQKISHLFLFIEVLFLL